MYQEEKDITHVAGTSLQGDVETSYKNLVRIFGKPTADTDGYKTDAEWNIQTPYGVATIYNYKDGKNYCGDEGLEVEDITDWHIGGHNFDTAEYIRDRVLNLKCPDCDKYKLEDKGNMYACSECESEVEKCIHCGGALEVEDSDCCPFCKLD